MINGSTSRKVPASAAGGSLRHILSTRFVLTTMTLLLAVSGASLAQTLTPLVNNPPDGIVMTFQLTDGTVMAQGNNDNDWWKLTPDINGSYVNGTWTQLASLPAGYAPYANASAVLADGRLVIIGGEYNFGVFTLTNLGAIYDPVANTWTSLAPPAGWDFIGDSPSLVLPNGRYVVGQKLTKQMAELDPKTLTWTALRSKGKSDFNAEEGWTLLPDGSILTADVLHAPNSEIYSPSAQEWVSAGSTIVNLRSKTTEEGCVPYGNGSTLYCYFPPGEIGPQILRPDGTVFVTGSFTSISTDGFTGPGNTSVYDTVTGTWTPGPIFPNDDNAGDAFAVLLTDGNVLVEGDTGIGYEFDGTDLTQTAILTPQLFVESSLMVLPTGEVLVGSFASAETYTSTGTYQSSWAPTISSYPTTVTRGSTYQIYGTQFNGLSQAAAFGDELQTATNYPLVRITNNSTEHVFYARTHDHSTMGVATGTATVSTNFDVPVSMETGPSTLVVVANGIPSLPVSVTVQ